MVDLETLDVPSDGDELLTTSNPACETDRKLLKEVGVSFNKNFEYKKNTLTIK